MSYDEQDIASRGPKRKARSKVQNVAPDPRFHSGVVGAGAVKTALGKLIKADGAKAARIFRAVTNSGLRGAGPLGHLTKLVLFGAGDGDYPVAPKDLAATPGLTTIIEERARVIIDELDIDKRKPPTPASGPGRAAPPVPGPRRELRGRGGFDPYA